MSITKVSSAVTIPRSMLVCAFAPNPLNASTINTIVSSASKKKQSNYLSSFCKIITNFFRKIWLCLFPRSKIAEESSCIELLKKRLTEKRVQEAVSSVERVFAKSRIHFPQAFANHKLHCDMALITEAVKNRKDLQGPWNAYLRSAQGRPVVYPDGTERRLDFSREIRSLQGIKSEVQISTLKTDQELNEAFELEIECFGSRQIPPKDYMLDSLKNHNGSVILAKDSKTQKIIGFLWYFNQADGGIEIAGVGRSPDAPRMGIGEKMFDEFIKIMSPKRAAVNLHVRVSNESAIALYKSFGFEIRKREEYYSSPKEDAYIMDLNWAHVLKRASSAA